jgi:hypothetical protein
MRSSSVVAGVLAAVVLAAGVVVAEGPSDFCARVVGGTERVEPLAARGSAFSARKVEDLRFLVVFVDPVEGEHVLELRLKTPRGQLYESMSVPFTTERVERGAERAVAGYPRPLPLHAVRQVQVGEGARQGVSVQASLPVAGTTIMTDSLYGTWEIQLVMDGVPMGCELRSSFLLTE